MIDAVRKSPGRERVAGGGRLALALALVATLGGCPAGGGAGGSNSHAIASGSALQQVIDNKKLVVGMEVEFPPFEFKDLETGEIKGFDVDIVRMLAQELEVELEIVEIEFSGLFGSLITGKVDLAVSGITATLKRAKKLSFSRPYFITQLCLLASKDSKVQSYRELDDESVTIVVKQGTTGQITAEKMFPKAKLKVFDQEAACALEIANGNGDVFIYDKATLRKHYENHKAKTRFLPEPFSVEPYAMAFRRGDPDFGRFLDQFLMTIELDGRLAELRRKWGLDK